MIRHRNHAITKPLGVANMRGVLPHRRLMLDTIFWTLVALEGATAAVLLAFVLKDSPKNSDYSLGMFLTVSPLLALISVALVYRYTKSTPVHAVLLVVPSLLTIPGINAMYNYYGSIVA